MTKTRSLSFACVLLSASLLTAPAFALGLGGGLGGTAGGMIGPSGVGGSIGGTVNGTIDSTMRTGDRVGAINERANRVIDRTQDRVNGVKVPEAPSADDLNQALKAAGYADAALDTPAGSASGSGSADGSGELTMPAAEKPALPDPNAAVDQVQAVKDEAVSRTASALPEGGPVSVSVSANANGDAAASTGQTEPAAEEPAADEPTSPAEQNDPSLR